MGSHKVLAVLMGIVILLVSIGLSLLFPYLSDRRNYLNGHQAYLQGDCDAALRSFERIQTGWHLVPLGDYASLAYPEWIACAYPWLEYLAGRIWLLDSIGENLIIRELDVASFADPLGEHEFESIFEDKGEMGVISPGGKYFLPRPSATDMMLVNLSDGGTRSLAFPGDIYVYPEDDFYGAFSPDERYLVYTLNSRNNYYRNGVFLLDLASGETNSLYESPCAFYLAVGTVCGETGQPYWLDGETLLVSAFTGEMPFQVPVGAESPSPNSYIVLATDGSLQVTEGVFPVTAQVQVSATSVGFLRASGLHWTAITDLLQGSFQANVLPAETAFLSPDGRYVLRTIDDQWLLTELATSVDQEIGALAVADCDPRKVGWSPDGKFVVCVTRETTDQFDQLQHTLRLIVLEGSQTQILLPAYYSGDWESFLAWLP